MLCAEDALLRPNYSGDVCIYAHSAFCYARKSIYTSRHAELKGYNHVISGYLGIEAGDFTLQLSMCKEDDPQMKLERLSLAGLAIQIHPTWATQR